ncbi:MAG: hypothetical protein ACLFPN_05190 [Methanomassiliicoccales archaeon]
MDIRTGFGWIEIDGEHYHHDVIIHRDGSVSRRQKELSRHLRDEYGHTPLTVEELDFLKEESPSTVLIGTGQHGDLCLTPGARELLRDYWTVLLPTPDAIHELREGWVAILHVTC